LQHRWQVWVARRDGGCTICHLGKLSLGIGLPLSCIAGLSRSPNFLYIDIFSSHFHKHKSKPDELLLLLRLFVGFCSYAAEGSGPENAKEHNKLGSRIRIGIRVKGTVRGTHVRSTALTVILHNCRAKKRRYGPAPA